MSETNELLRKWTKSVMSLSLVFITMIIIGQTISVIYLYINHLLNISLSKKILYKILIPAFINIIVFIIGSLLLKRKSFTIDQKGIIPLIVVGIISLVFIITNYNVPTCILSLLLPILLSILNLDVNKTNKTAIPCCIVTLLIATSLLYINIDLGYNYMMNMIVSVAFIIALTITASTMAKLENQKNKLLLTSVKERKYYYDKSIIDCLTESYNHASYMETINNNFDKYDNLVLAIIDIDNFKKVNDTYGHSKGDIVLMSLAKILNKLNSEEVFVARYGGEEFVILFFDKDIKDAYEIISKLKDRFASKIYPELDNNNVTFSCGIAAKKKSSTITTLFDEADKALYKAKENGKNQIIVEK